MNRTVLSVSAVSADGKDFLSNPRKGDPNGSLQKIVTYNEIVNLEKIIEK